MVWPPGSDTVARYWDDNRDTSRDPTYWMAHPVCREAINRRVTGSPHEWPLDWFKRVHVPEPFHRGISWGCGLGGFERSALKIGVVSEIDAFDISPASVEDARREAQAAGVAGIHYRVGDFNAPRLTRGRYDIVFFHASLHHVARLDRLFERLSKAFVPGGAVYVDEYVGPSFDAWDTVRLRAAQELLDSCPWSAKRWSFLDAPVNKYDPSEAVRSGEIREFLRDYFEIVEWKPFGGQLSGIVFPYLAPGWTETEGGTAFVRRVMAMEDEQLQADPESTHHLVAIGRLKERSGRPGWPRRLRRLTGRGSWKLRRAAQLVWLARPRPERYLRTKRNGP
jgi:SAM-dependent methyltransferase